MLATAKGYYNGSRIVFDSPVQFQRGQEVIVTYAIIDSFPKKKNLGALVDSLVGSIPSSEKTLADYRLERLRKYASVD